MRFSDDEIEILQKAVQLIGNLIDRPKIKAQKTYIDLKEYYTVEEAAKYLGYSKSAITKSMKGEGAFNISTKGVIVLKNRFLIPVETIDRIKSTLSGGN